MIKTIKIEANTSEEQAKKILLNKVKELNDFHVTFKDGDIMILDQFCYTSYHYVLFQGKWFMFSEH